MRIGFLTLYAKYAGQTDDSGVRLVYHVVRLDCLFVGGHGVSHQHITVHPTQLRSGPSPPTAG